MNNTSSEAIDLSSGRLTALGLGHSFIYPWAMVTLCCLGMMFTPIFCYALAQERGKAVEFLLMLFGLSNLVSLPLIFVYVLHFYLLEGNEPFTGHQYSWVVYFLLQTNICDTCHIYFHLLLIAVGLLQYLTVRQSKVSKRTFGMRATQVLAAFLFCISVVFSLPNYISYQIVPLGQGYTLSLSAEARASDGFLSKTNAWLHSGVADSLAGLALIVLCGLLISATYKMARRRRRLFRNKHGSRQLRRLYQTTISLTTVIVIVSLTELHRTSLFIMSVLIHKDGYALLHSSHRIVIELTSIAQSSLCFWLYVCMNGRFRAHVGRLFGCTIRWDELKSTDSGYRNNIPLIVTHRVARNQSGSRAARAQEAENLSIEVGEVYLGVNAYQTPVEWTCRKGTHVQRSCNLPRSKRTYHLAAPLYPVFSNYDSASSDNCFGQRTVEAKVIVHKVDTPTASKTSSGKGSI